MRVWLVCLIVMQVGCFPSRLVFWPWKNTACRTPYRLDYYCCIGLRCDVVRCIALHSVFVLSEAMIFSGLFAIGAVATIKVSRNATRSFNTSNDELRDPADKC